MSFKPLILVTPPERLRQVQGLQVTVGHRAYRIGRGPHLFRAGAPMAVRGGMMVVDERGFDGRGQPGALCEEVLRECAARGFQGVVCDFRGQAIPLLQRVLGQLGERMSRRGLRLYVPESYGGAVPQAQVLIPTALSGGSLQSRLEEAARHWGTQRLTLAIQRTAEDFSLPSPNGCGRPLDRETLEREIRERQPSVFFSHELCARYFTYMDRGSGAHFVLFDDGDTIRKKLQLARGLGVEEAVADFEELEDLLDQLELGKK